MKYLVFVLAASYLCNLVNGREGRSPQASWDWDPRYDPRVWKEPYDKVYAQTEAEKLTPAETLEWLKVLEKKYEVRRDGNAVNYPLLEVRKYIEVSNVNEEKCAKHRDTLAKINSLMLGKSNYINLYGYLNHYKLKQYELCKNRLTENFASAIERIPGGRKTELEELKAAIIKADKNNLAFVDLLHGAGQEARLKGTLSYLERRAGPLSLKEAHPKTEQLNFRRVLDEYVLGPCNEVVTNLVAIKPFQALSYSENPAATFDPVVSDWLDIYQMCERLNREADNLYENGYSLFADWKESRLDLAPQPKPIKQTRFSNWPNCFGCLRNNQ